MARVKRVEQMQDRVLHPADILIDRQPVPHRVGVGGNVRPRRAEPREIPGQVDERVHRVRLAQPRPTAFGAGQILPGGMTVERIAGHVERDVVGELHGQIGVRNRNDPARRAMDHGDGAAPIALARNAPVA